VSAAPTTTAAGTTWRQRLLSGAVGFVLAAAGFYLFDLTGHRGDDPPPRPAPERVAAKPAGQPAAGDGDGECYLGVVLARESVGVASEVEGQLEEVLVRVGDAVERGQKLAVLDTRTLTHQLAIERAALRVAQADQRNFELQGARVDQEYRRRQTLEDVLSREELESSGFDVEVAAARLEAAAAEVAGVEARIGQLETQLASSVIRAPFAATVAERHLDPGALVAPGMPIVRLISSGGALVRFAVPPDDAGRLSLGAPLRVEIETTGTVLHGAVENLAPEIDAASQMVFVEAGLEPSAEVTAAVPSGSIARVALSAPTPPVSCLGRSETDTHPATDVG
jgi:RND family efflux transporter MFP subunit